MEGESKNQKPKMARKGRKKVVSAADESPSQLKKQNIDQDAQPSAIPDPDSSSGWSNEVIEPAIKSMAFRKRRGTRMKDLIKGKHRKDHFWDKYQDYFGGNLDKPEDEDDQEDYQASSSGRDQFDSDFDLTDSYVGKRGRKKGTKVKRKKRPITKPAEKKEELEPKPKGKRGRKKKVPVDPPVQQNPEPLLKEEGFPNQENPQKVKESNGVHAMEALIESREEGQASKGKQDLRQVRNGALGSNCGGKHLRDGQELGRQLVGEEGKSGKAGIEEREQMEAEIEDAI